jgi:hypothetical protein
MVLILLAVAALAAFRIYKLDPGRLRPSLPAQPSPAPLPILVGARRVNARDYPGDDIGTKINNAAKALGRGGGEIILNSGGLFKVTAIIPSGCVVLLKGGLYKSVTPGPLILLSDDSALLGDNWDAILEESTGEATPAGVSPTTGRPLHTIVQDLAGATLNGSASRGIRVEHVHFRGARKDFQSAFQTVALGNCRGVRAVSNFFELTRAIALQVGGAGGMGNYAQDCTLEDNKFVGVATQNIAITNAVRVSAKRNTFERSGQLGAPGSTCIDLEPNVGDRVEDVMIQGNVIDCRHTPIDASGRKVLNAISINNGNGANPWKNIQVVDNEILSNLVGGGVGYAGILVRSCVGTVVARNTLTRCVRGILVDTGSRLNRIEQNTLRSCASGSTAAIEIQDTSRGNIVRGNRFEAIPGDGFEEVAGRIWTVPGNVIEGNIGAR